MTDLHDPTLRERTPIETEADVERLVRRSYQLFTGERAELAKQRAHLAGEAIAALVRRHQRGIRSLPLSAVSRRG